VDALEIGRPLGLPPEHFRLVRENASPVDGLASLGAGRVWGLDRRIHSQGYETIPRLFGNYILSMGVRVRLRCLFS
jgi:hypothetical protein